MTHAAAPRQARFRALMLSTLSAAALLPSAAMAQDSFTFNGTLVQTRTFTPPFGSGGGQPTGYQAIQVTVTDAGAFGATVPTTNFAPIGPTTAGSFDPDLLLYNGDFDPASVFTNVIQISDGFFDPELTPVATEGEYTIVVTTFHTNLYGPYTLSVVGATLGWGPSVMEEIAALAAGASAGSRLIVLNASGVARLRGQDSLATRDELISFTRVADPRAGDILVTQSTMDRAQMMGAIYAWVEVTGFRAEDDGRDRSYSGRGIQIGADVALSPDMVAGVSLGVTDMDASLGATSQDGLVRFLQPYLAYSAGAWSGEASLFLGQGDFDQVSAGGDGSGRTRIVALTFDGGYDFELDAATTLTPRIGLVHGRERVEGRTGTLAGAGTETIRFTRVSLGGEVSRSTGTGEIFAGLHADWLDTSAETALVSDLLQDDGWTGRLEIGVSAEIGRGIQLDTTLSLGGLGGDLRTGNGALNFAMRF